MTTEYVGVYSPEPRVKVYGLKLNFNMSKIIGLLATIALANVEMESFH